MAFLALHSFWLSVYSAINSDPDPGGLGLGGGVKGLCSAMSHFLCCGHVGDRDIRRRFAMTILQEGLMQYESCLLSYDQASYHFLIISRHLSFQKAYLWNIIVW